MRGPRLIAILTAVIVLLLSNVALANAAHPAGSTGPDIWGWAVVRDPGASHLISAASDHGSSSGGKVRFNRNGIGLYEVVFRGLDTSGLDNGGVPFVTPLTKGPKICQISDWGPGTGRYQVLIACRSNSGDFADVPFIVNFLALSSFSGHVGYAYANDSDSADYTPQSQSQYDASGPSDDATVTKLGTGSWRVHIPNQGADRGDVQVSAVGLAGTCRVVTWDNDAGVQDIQTDCTDLTGAHTDATYTIVYLRNMGLKGPQVGAGGPKNVGYLWANRSTAASYHPAADYRYTSSGQVPQIKRSQVGRYTMYLPDGAPVRFAQVTAYGTDTDHCVVSSLRVSTPSPRVGVRCFATDGSPADDRFTLTWGR